MTTSALLSARHARFAFGVGAGKRSAAAACGEAHGWEDRPDRTQGHPHQRRRDQGSTARRGRRRKGLFTKEIDAALLATAQSTPLSHSAKDLPSRPPDGVAVAAPFCHARTCGTRWSRSSPTRSKACRRALRSRRSRLRCAGRPNALRLRPDLRFELLRGNVETRLRKAEGRGGGRDPARACRPEAAEALPIAPAHVLEVDAFLPAVGQGAIAITARRARNARVADALGPISDAETSAALTAERAFLAELEGSCRTPIAGLARHEAARLRFKGEVLRVDGSERFESRRRGRLPRRRRAPWARGRARPGRAPPRGDPGEEAAERDSAGARPLGQVRFRLRRSNVRFYGRRSMLSARWASSKRRQASPNKNAWNCLDLFVKIGTLNGLQRLK